MRYTADVQIWRTITSYVQRALSPRQFLFASVETPVSQEYAAINSLSTLASFVWVWVCVDKISTDLAARELKAHRRQSRQAPWQETDDPALELLDNPNATTTGFLFRKQLWIDILLPGNAFVWRPPEGVAIYRLHPEEVEPIAGPLGVVRAYRWTDTVSGQEQILPPDEVIHIRGASWQAGAQAVLGESAIRALHDDLSIDIGMRKSAKEQAGRGRPDILFSADTALGPDGANPLVKRWEESMRARHGAFFMGMGVKATKLSWSPDESRDIERATKLRDDTLALFGVPQSVVGVGESNYATARQGAKDYWQNNQARVRIVDDALSKLAIPGTRLSHSFDDVEALQVSFGDKLERAEGLVRLGAKPREALDYVGLVGAPAGEEPRMGAQPPAAKKPSDASDEPAEPTDRATQVRNAVCQTAATLGEALEQGRDADASLLWRWQYTHLVEQLRAVGLDDGTAEALTAEVLGILRTADEMGERHIFKEASAGRIATRLLSEIT